MSIPAFGAVVDRQFQLRKASLVVAAILWATIVAALFVAWLAAPARSGYDRLACASLGRAGERCPETAFASVNDLRCASHGRGGLMCSTKP